MERCLIIAKNVLAEKKFQEQIQSMGHEAYCTTSLLSDDSDYEITNFFSVLIISESITKEELCRILAKTEQRKIKKVRKIDEAPKTDEQNELISLGIEAWLGERSSIEEFHKALYVNDSSYLPKETTESKLNGEVSEITELMYSFSKLERSLFFKLLEMRGGIISREELCIELWEDQCFSQTHLIQLSTLTRNIKTKLRKMHFKGTSIETVWGRGYRLNRNFIKELKL